jgi:hypothetical protein
MTCIDLLQRYVETACLFVCPAKSPEVDHVITLAVNMCTANEG